MLRIAHRSGPVRYPGQTIVSARQAMEDGADFVEIDVRFTKDGMLAISHDDHAGYVFGVNKNISEMTGQEFLTMRHKDAPAYPSHTLADYMRSSISQLLLHVKQGGERVYDIMDEIENYGYTDKVVMGVCDAREARMIKTRNERMRVLGFIDENETGYINDFASAGADYIRLWEPWVTQERVNQIQALGKKVWVMAGWITVDLPVGYTDPENMEKWERMGIDAVLLNDIRTGQKEKAAVR